MDTLLDEIVAIIENNMEFHKSMITVGSTESWLGRYLEDEFLLNEITKLRNE